MDESARHFAVEGSGTTFIHPVGACMLFVCGVLLFALPRRYALWPFIVLVCFVSSRQCIAIAGFNLYFARFMILFFGVARVLLRNDTPMIRWNRLDILVIVYGLFYFVAGAVNWDFSPAEMKTRSGYVIEVMGTYLLCRVLIRDKEDGRNVVACLSIVASVLVGFFVLEHQTKRNVFAVFGGVSEITIERGERLRCQGAFGHPIVAGVFWATMLPLIVCGAWDKWRWRRIHALGAVAAVGIIILTASIYALVNGLQVFFYPAILASGGPGFYVLVHSFYTTGVGIACLIGVSHGIHALIWALIVNGSVMTVPSLLFLRQRIGLNPWRYCQVCLWPLVAAGLMFCTVWFTSSGISTSAPVWLRLALEVPSGALVYVGTLGLFNRGSLNRAAEVISNAIGREKGLNRGVVVVRGSA